MPLEIRPNIFIQKEGELTRIVSLPDGYEDMKDNWEWVKTCGNNTICMKTVDTIREVLDEYCSRLLLGGKINTEEGTKAKEDYFNYTGIEWKSQGFYYKRG